MRLRALLGALSLVLMGIAGVATATPAAAATGNILPPFNIGETWSVCEGYNHGTHTGTSAYGLDLVKNANGSCDGSSAGATVRAPISGTVAYPYQATYGNLCINIAGGRSYTLTHITSSITGTVTAGQVVGTVGAAGSYNNNNVAHIHFQMWATANCYSSSGIPFDSDHGAQICGAPDLTAIGPDDNNNGTWSGTPFTGQSCGGAATRAGIRNGGFNNGASNWSVTGSANIATYGPSGSYEGDGYAATNASASGDSIRQDVVVNSSAGKSYCVSAQVRTNGSGSGAGGSMAIWLMGGSANENSVRYFSGLTNDWKPITTCVTATSSHTSLRVQIFPTVGAPTLAVDAVDMHESLLNAAGFNGSSSGWSRTGTAGFALYSSDTYEGSGYAAANAPSAGDSIRQDVTRSIATGATYCVDAHVKSNISGATSSGTLALWMMGGSGNENSTYRFTNIGNAWTPISTCITATGSHTSLRVQIFPDNNTPTIGMDAVALHPTLAVNGGFNNGASSWSVTGSANIAAYGPSGSYEGDGYGATNASASGDSIRQDVTRSIAAGDMYCVSAQVRTNGSGTSGAAGTLALWMMGGSGNENSTFVFSGLDDKWAPIKTCVTATTGHTSLRIQVFPTVGAPTLAVDAIDMG